MWNVEPSGRWGRQLETDPWWRSYVWTLSTCFRKAALLCLATSMPSVLLRLLNNFKKNLCRVWTFSYEFLKLLCFALLLFALHFGSFDFFWITSCTSVEAGCSRRRSCKVSSKAAISYTVRRAPRRRFHLRVISALIWRCETSLPWRWWSVMAFAPSAAKLWRQFSKPDLF